MTRGLRTVKILRTKAYRLWLGERRLFELARLPGMSAVQSLSGAKQTLEQASSSYEDRLRSKVSAARRSATQNSSPSAHSVERLQYRRVFRIRRSKSPRVGLVCSISHTRLPPVRATGCRSKPADAKRAHKCPVAARPAGNPSAPRLAGLLARRYLISVLLRT
jgi:hypothetical protein